jgi:hypothetical protein
VACAANAFSVPLPFARKMCGRRRSPSARPKSSAVWYSSLNWVGDSSTAVPRTEARWVSRTTIRPGMSSSSPIKAERMAIAQPVSWYRGGTNGSTAANRRMTRMMMTLSTTMKM